MEVHLSQKPAFFVAAAMVLAVLGSRAASADPRLCASDADCGQGGTCPAGVCLYGKDATEAQSGKLPYGATPAQAATLPPPPSERTVPVWYGQQIYLADGLNTLVLDPLGGEVLFGHSYGWAAGLILGTYFIYPFSGPIVHLAHGNVGRAFASLGLRIGLPILAAAALNNHSCDHYEEDGICVDSGVFFGLVFGGIAAVLLDGAVLAYDEVPVSSIEQSASRFSVLPTLAVVRGGGVVGVGGTF
jgi:hypothetical protein